MDHRILKPDELKQFSNSTFHLTCRAIDDLHVFADRQDKREFLNRFERHLSSREFRDRYRRPFPKYREGVRLFGFGVLDNHFHLLLHQFAAEGIRRLMRSVMVSYGRYFNDRYSRTGPIFQSAFQSRMIADAEHAKRSIAYVHLNHEVERERYEFCSHDYYVGRRRCDWLDSAMGLRVFGGRAAYLAYMDRNADRLLDEKRKRREHDSKRHGIPVRRGPASHVARIVKPKNAAS